MENIEKYYITVLRDELCNRQRRNSSYSLRSYARDIGVHAGSLSQILKGQRSLPFNKAKTVLEELSLADDQRTLFLESFYRSKTNIDHIEIEELDTRYVVDKANYEVLAQWEHFAVMEMFELSNFSVSLKSVEEKLKISFLRAKQVMENLLKAGLIKEVEGGGFLPLHEGVRTTEDINSRALRDSHLETMDMGKEKLKDIEVELRDFSSTTLALDLEKLPEAKTIIREFRQKMSALLRDGNKTEIYQLAVQFFPLTEKEQENESV